ncbi:MAG: DUF3592 domain-containing protein [Clostridia bacterium]|nr:DUF3592 domain-containing protein [Clostridia bacterium]MBQ6426874.1 DUF3592 domain-containing protein [Clostridia bacterium]
MNKIITIIRESAAARFLIPAGIILIVFGIVFFGVSKQNQNFRQTEASVIGAEPEKAAAADPGETPADETYLLRIRYTVDGREYESDLSGMSKHEAGDRITVFYDPDDPSRITQTKSLIIPLIIIAAGIGACAAGIISGIHAVKRYAKMKEQEKEWGTYGK